VETGIKIAYRLGRARSAAGVVLQSSSSKKRVFARKANISASYTNLARTSAVRKVKTTGETTPYREGEGGLAKWTNLDDLCSFA
jgi:hypothetical protein